MSEPSGVTGALTRPDRVVVAALLLLVAMLAWAFTVHQARLMDAMDAAMWRDMNMSMNGMEPSWTLIDAALVFVMWSAMMAAMMVPGAAPMIAAFATINRRRREREAPYVPTAVFLAGYLVVWSGFSLIATGPAICAAKGRAAHHHDAIGVSCFFRRAVLRRRALSIQSVEGALSCLLPFARRLHPERMARRRARCRRHGACAMACSAWAAARR